MKNFLRSLAAGAATMYFFDPEIGRTRRARVRDKTRRFFGDAEDFFRTAVTDLRNRARGGIEEAKSFLGRRDASDSNPFPPSHLTYQSKRSTAQMETRGISTPVPSSAG